MEFLEERESVIAAGKRLVETGLIARTWGNVSCRAGENRFAVTPTGRAYESLRPEDIVIVDIADLSYSGPVKPSSEKGVHAEVYVQKPEASFVIHTHQPDASVAAALGQRIGMVKHIIGGAPLASYGLPGTKKLRRGVADALKRAQGRALLMAHHGALCWGKSPEEAFAAALALEEACAGLVKVGPSAPAGALPAEELARAIRSARADIHVVRHSALPAVVEASRRSRTVRPYLDDFAQLIGLSARCVARDAGIPALIRALRGRNAVLVEGCGALCCAENGEDAEAVEMVLDKGCRAALTADAYGAKPIAPAECALMRFVYLNKYSKQEKRNRRTTG